MIGGLTMLDYTQKPKKFLEVKLFDGKIVKIGAPKKKLFTRLAALETMLNGEKTPETMYDEILSTAAEVLSNNPGQETFTKEDVDGLMDIEDMALLLREYALFAGGLTKSPN